LISLRKTATELDRLEDFNRTAVNCYSHAIRSTEQHAVEVDSAHLAHFRAQLQALKNRLQDAAQPSQLEAVQTSFDAELKDYRDKTREQIDHLRREIKAATAAVESFATSVTANGTELESGLKHELQRLNQAAASDDVNQMRGAIRTATTKIAASVEHMRSANQLVIAQLKDEIRLLHQEVRAARRSNSAEPEPAKESRQKIDSQIDTLMRQGNGFSVLLVVVTNLEGMRNIHSSQLIENGLRAFESRFQSIVPGAAMTGRWSKDQFAAVLGTEPANAIAMSSEVMQKLSAPFIEQDQGTSRSLSFNVKAGVIEFRPGTDPSKFQAKLKQLAGALAG
jgi:GGDEF domain-containing protein